LAARLLRIAGRGWLLHVLLTLLLPLLLALLLLRLRLLLLLLLLLHLRLQLGEIGHAALAAAADLLLRGSLLLSEGLQRRKLGLVRARLGSGAHAARLRLLRLLRLPAGLLSHAGGHLLLRRALCLLLLLARLLALRLLAGLDAESSGTARGLQSGHRLRAHGLQPLHLHAEMRLRLCLLLRVGLCRNGGPLAL
jgi:hypothetical protein